ncbi:MAG: hypothetical protein H6738_10425 [Alphaproteobacteria bacterium]|nr:hypothetical protein [Alphaproteobacteria bacterium]MCB9697184.1 hypothetical protein [Alphaproteobacteria bacterium]
MLHQTVVGSWTNSNPSTVAGVPRSIRAQCGCGAEMLDALVPSSPSKIWPGKSWTFVVTPTCVGATLKVLGDTGTMPDGSHVLASTAAGTGGCRTAVPSTPATPVYRRVGLSRPSEVFAQAPPGTTNEPGVPLARPKVPFGVTPR